jgi:cobalt-zinc-cadmium efflux system outer membrane protein
MSIFRSWLSVALAYFVLVSPLAYADPQESAETIVEFQNPSGVITLVEVLSLALQQSPSLKAFSWEIRAAEARTIQAGLRPNPELSLEIEEVRWTSGPGTVSDSISLGGALTEGSISIPSGDGQNPLSIPTLGVTPSLGFERVREQGARSGFSEAEITLSVSQLIELGGKRAKRVRLAKREQELAQWDYEAARANVIESVATAFVNVLASQERLALQTELAGLAEQVQQTVSKMVQAGAVSPLEENRAKVILDSTRIEQERATRELQAARVALAATWGEKRAMFERAVGHLDDIHQVPALDTLESSINQNPDIARWATEMARRDAAFTLARAQRIPSPAVALGFRSTGIGSRGTTAYGFDTEGILGFNHTRLDGESSRDNSLVLGFSIPLPLFDRNQGNIKEAEYLISKTSEERRATESAIFATLAAAYEGISATLNEIQVLTKEILPTATETFEKTQEGYRQGKFGYLDVLDAERTLFDARRQYLDALSAYHTQLVRLERLTGLSISSEAALPVDSTTEKIDHDTK